MYLGLFSINKKTISFEFKTKNEYYKFLLHNKDRILWSNLINNINGEEVDVYKNIKEIDFFDVRILLEPEECENSKGMIILNKQQIDLINIFINEYLPNINIPEIKFNYLRYQDYFDEKIIVSNFLIVMQKEKLEYLIKIIKEKLTKPYLINEFNEMIVLTGREIPLTKELILRK